MCRSFSIELRSAGRSLAKAVAILLAASTAAFAQAPQSNPPAPTVVASKPVGPWIVNGYAAGHCIAERVVAVTTGGVALNYGVLRNSGGYRLLVLANDWQLTPGATFPVELDAAPAFRNETMANAFAPKLIGIELGANGDLIQRLAGLPNIRIKAAQAVFTLPLDVFQAALAELDSCFDARKKSLSNPFVTPGAAPQQPKPQTQSAAPPSPSPQQSARAPQPAETDGRLPAAEPVSAKKQEGELVEERTFLTVRKGDMSYRLETLVVRPAKASGRLPIALITHGKDALAQQMMDLRADRMLPQARDLAERGWLAVVVVRRGFGRSEGVAGVARGSAYMSCVNPDVARGFDTEADDLEGALQALAERPDADVSRVIAIGNSVGGGTVLAFAARQPKGLRAVINVSGGVRIINGDGTQCAAEALPSAMTAFGSRTKVPTLWLYAENDSLFGPELVRGMHEAYAKAGGRVDLQMFPALQQDGHALFVDLNGRIKWLASLDKFLRANQLQSWNVARVNDIMKMAKIAPGHHAFVTNYLALPTQKALAVSPNGVHLFSHVNSHDLAQARMQVLARCKEKAGTECILVLANSELAIAPRKQAALAD
jgi:dienelactone hydrolase